MSAVLTRSEYQIIVANLAAGSRFLSDLMLHDAVLRARVAALEAALRDVLARNVLTPNEQERIAAVLEGKS